MGKRVTNVAQGKKLKTSWEEELKGFLFFKQAQGVSQTTLNDYKRHVEYFFHRYPNSLGDRLEIYSKVLGVRIRPYDLRHTFALLYLGSCGNAFGLQKSLGHVDMSMTKRYVNLSGNDLQEIHKTASPLNRLITNKNRVWKITK